MEKFVEQGYLYDFYGELLTERQQQVYESVVLEDYSLSEVAEDLGISRQGVHDMVKRCNKSPGEKNTGSGTGVSFRGNCKYIQRDFRGVIIYGI